MTTHNDNPRFPHTCVITRRIDDDDPMKDDDTFVTIYSGACRSFDFHTTSETGDVLTSTRKLSLPVKQNEWHEYDASNDESDESSDDSDVRLFIPQEGDSVVVNKGSYTEYGTVIDRMPGNLGTHILWKYGRN